MLCLEVAQHLGEDLHVALVHHARADETEVDLLGPAVVRQLTNGVVGVALRRVVVVHVGVGDHRFVDLIEVDGELGVVLRVGVGSQRRALTALDLGDPGVGAIDEALEHGVGVVHALVDHHLDAIAGDHERLDEGLAVGDVDRGLRLHLGGPVGERECLVGGERADVNLDDPALEDVLAVELLQHLCLGGVHDIAEVHVGGHVAFEGDLDRFGDRHRCFAGGEGEGDRAGVGAERHTLRHAGVGVAADDDRPVVDGDVVEDLVDHVGHRGVVVLRVAGGDQPEVVHEFHQARDVLLRLGVPHRGRVAARLVAGVDNR